MITCLCTPIRPSNFSFHSSVSLASTERAVDQIFGRLLQSLSLPHLHANVVEWLLKALTEQHPSAPALVFRSKPLSFLLPLETSADVAQTGTNSDSRK